MTDAHSGDGIGTWAPVALPTATEPDTVEPSEHRHGPTWYVAALPGNG